MYACWPGAWVPHARPASAAGWAELLWWLPGLGPVPQPPALPLPLPLAAFTVHEVAAPHPPLPLAAFTEHHEVAAPASPPCSLHCARGGAGRVRPAGEGGGARGPVTGRSAAGVQGACRQAPHSQPVPQPYHHHTHTQTHSPRTRLDTRHLFLLSCKLQLRGPDSESSADCARLLCVRSSKRQLCLYSSLTVLYLVASCPLALGPWPQRGRARCRHQCWRGRWAAWLRVPALRRGPARRTAAAALPRRARRPSEAPAWSKRDMGSPGEGDSGGSST